MSRTCSHGSPCFPVPVDPKRPALGTKMETPMELREKLIMALDEQDLDEAQILICL